MPICTEPSRERNQQDSVSKWRGRRFPLSGGRKRGLWGTPQRTREERDLILQLMIRRETGNQVGGGKPPSGEPPSQSQENPVPSRGRNGLQRRLLLQAREKTRIFLSRSGNPRNREIRLKN